MQALLDTSVVIAEAKALPLASEDSAAISILTIGELRAGVLLAGDPIVRARRQARFAAIGEMFEPIPVGQEVSLQYGELLAFARRRRRSSKATDLLIVATAAATGRTLLTHDQAQASLAALAGIPVNP